MSSVAKDAQQEVASLPSSELVALSEQNVDLALQLSELESSHLEDQANLAAMRERLQSLALSLQNLASQNKALKAQIVTTHRIISELTAERDLLLQHNCSLADVISTQRAPNEQVKQLQASLAQANELISLSYAQAQGRSTEAAQETQLDLPAAQPLPSLQALQEQLYEILGISGMTLFNRLSKDRSLKLEESSFSFATLAGFLEAIKPPAQKLCRSKESQEKLAACFARFEEQLQASQVGLELSQAAIAQAADISTAVAYPEPLAPAAALAESDGPQDKEAEPTLETDLTEKEQSAGSDPVISELSALTSGLVNEIETSAPQEPAPEPQQAAPTPPPIPTPIEALIPNIIINSVDYSRCTQVVSSMVSKNVTSYSLPAQRMLNKIIWNPSALDRRERLYYNPAANLNIDSSILADAIDSDLNQMLKWLNEAVLPRASTSYTDPVESFNSLIVNSQELAGSCGPLVRLTESLNSEIFKLPSLDISFFSKKPLTLGISTPSPRIAISDHLMRIPLAQATFLIASQLFAILRHYQEQRNALQGVLKGEQELSELGATLLKRTISLVVEKGTMLPPDLLGEASSFWGDESIEEITDLLERCYVASSFPQFRFIEELIANPYPLRQVMDLEADRLALKFSNLMDASLAITRIVAGKRLTELCENEGMRVAFEANYREAYYLRQRLSTLWVNCLLTNSL